MRSNTVIAVYKHIAITANALRLMDTVFDSNINIANINIAEIIIIYVIESTEEPLVLY